eukprot:m.70956 g.70956  ORF g.70956 m.70956 type:complete len:168 (-) comp13797_c0_seq5:271-774(-)
MFATDPESVAGPNTSGMSLCSGFFARLSLDSLALDLLLAEGVGSVETGLTPLFTSSRGLLFTPVVSAAVKWPGPCCFRLEAAASAASDCAKRLISAMFNRPKGKSSLCSSEQAHYTKRKRSIEHPIDGCPKRKPKENITHERTAELINYKWKRNGYSCRPVALPEVS